MGGKAIVWGAQGVKRKDSVLVEVPDAGAHVCTVMWLGRKKERPQWLPGFDEGMELDDYQFLGMKSSYVFMIL